MASDQVKTLVDLYKEYEHCTLCELCHSRQAVMFGDGEPNAQVMLIAERVGGLDEQNRKLFSGPAGELLIKILAAPNVEIPRKDVYLTNLVLCRTPQDRAPRAGEIKKCSPRLQEQIEILLPKVIIAAGRLPMLYFLNLKGTLEEHRGWHEVNVLLHTIKTYLTFNPASALYGEPEDIKHKKMLMYEDWKKIGAYYREVIK